MAPIIEQSCQDPAESIDSVVAQHVVIDVPGMMADRIGSLWAQEERISRLERVERVIREAEAQA